LLVGLVAVFIGSLFLGKYPATFGEWLSALLPTDVEAGPRAVMLHQILWDIRMPRVLLGVLVGTALALSGAACQAVFTNPLVSPGVLGVLAGSGFGAALAIVLRFNHAGIQLMAFAGGMAAVAVAIGIANMGGGERLLMLILGGIISGAMFTAFLSLIKYVADPNDELPAITYWLMGNLSVARIRDILAALPFLLTGAVLLLFSGKALNVLSLGDDAAALGVEPSRLRLLTIAAATLLAATAVTLGGIIGWIGLIVPHLGRMLTGPDNRVLLPVSALLGAIIILLADDLSRSLFTVEVPIGITTSILGIPVFVILLRSVRRRCGQ